jgi:hypothetical protein
MSVFPMMMSLVGSLTVAYSSENRCMSLTEDLANLAAQMQSRIPEDIKAVVEQAAIDLVNSEIGDLALKVGDTISPFVLPNEIGKSLNRAATGRILG